MRRTCGRNGAGRLSARRRERATARQSLHVERPRLRAAMLLQARAVSRSTFSRSERLREYRHTRSKCVASQRLRSGLMKATLASPASRLQRNTLQSERNQRGRRGGAALRGVHDISSGAIRELLNSSTRCLQGFTTLCETTVCRSLRFPRRHQLTVEKVVPARFTFKGLINSTLGRIEMGVKSSHRGAWRTNRVNVNAGELFTATVGIPVWSCAASEMAMRVNQKEL